MGPSVVVAGVPDGGCDDARRTWMTATATTAATTTAVEVKGNGEGASRVSVRRASLSDACALTSTINDAFTHSTSLFAVEGSYRVTPDGTQGARPPWPVHCADFFGMEEQTSLGGEQVSDSVVNDIVYHA